MNSFAQNIARRRPSLASVVVVIFAAAIIVAAAAMTFELIQIQRSAAGECVDRSEPASGLSGDQPSGSAAWARRIISFPFSSSTCTP